MPGLIADGAIERMVDEQQLEIVSLRPGDELTRSMRADHHPVGHINRTARHELREELDDRFARVVQLQVTRVAIPNRRANLYQALAAVRRNRHRRVKAEVRELCVCVQAELQQLRLSVILNVLSSIVT
jgi:hypothetical protein